MLESGFMNITDLIQAHGANYAAKPAVIDSEGAVTWSDFSRSVRQIGFALRATGMRKGDRVAALGGNGHRLIELIFGTHRAGGCLVPVSSFLSPQQMQLLVKDAGASYFFCGNDYLSTGAEIRSSVPTVREGGWVSIDGDAPGWRGFDDFIALGDDAPIERWHEPGDTACLWYSSGTTGNPKGIIRSHQSLHALGVACGMDMNIDSRSVTLLGTPLSASGTWINMLSTIIAGGTVVAPAKCSAAEVIALVGEHHVSHAMLVPTQLNGILDEPSLASAKLGSLRGLLTLGSKLNGYTKSETLKRITPHLFELYGLTEGFGTLSKPSDHVGKPGSVGRPILGCEILIIDENDNELPTGEVGEIIGLGPFTMGGYYNREEETNRLVWKGRDGRVYLKSGDVGRKDEDGFVYILDRRKDMIITGGLNIYPADIEAVLGEHVDIVELVVVGAPHPKWGETPIGLVKLRAGSAATPEGLLEWANGRLARHQRLNRVVLWEDFPRNALGKLVKHQIRGDFLKGVAAEAEAVR